MILAASRLLAKDEKRIKELRRQIHDAKRQGDMDYAKELQEELDELLKED